MDRLTPVIFTDAWGSNVSIASLQGRDIPSPEPESELWMGAHEEGPAGTDRDGGPDLAAVVAADPVGELGEECVARFGPRLPFLLKVLAPGRAISIQAHPSAEQATTVRATTGDEVYVDDWAKPELLLAISPFEVFVGMREHAEVAELVGRLRRAARSPSWSRRPPSPTTRARHARVGARHPRRRGRRLGPRGRRGLRAAGGRRRRAGRRRRRRGAGGRGAPRRHRPGRAAAHAPPGAAAGGVHRRRGRGAALLRARARHRGARQLRQRRAGRPDQQAGQRGRAAAHRRPARRRRGRPRPRGRARARGVRQRLRPVPAVPGDPGARPARRAPARASPSACAGG